MNLFIYDQDTLQKDCIFFGEVVVVLLAVIIIKRCQVRKNIYKYLRHIQLINDISDVFYHQVAILAYKSLIKNICIYQYMVIKQL